MTTKRYTYHIRVAWLVLFIAIPTGHAFGQGDERTGTAGAAHLRVVPTARLSALGTAGSAGIAGSSGIEMLFANPAGLTLNRGTGALFSHIDYLVNVGINTLGVAQQIGNSQVAAFISSWSFGDIPRQTELNPEISNLTFSPEIITAAAGYARRFTDRIAGGITLKVVNEKIDDMSASAVALDGGLTYAIEEIGLRFGLSVRNIGSKLRYSGDGLSRQTPVPDQRPDADAGLLFIEAQEVDLPTLLNVGVSYSRSLSSNMSAAILTNFRSNAFDQDQYSAGLELGFVNVLYVRGGLELTPEQDFTLFSPGSFGAGLNFDVSGVGVAFDYAYRPTDVFSDVQLFTLNLSI